MKCHLERLETLKGGSLQTPCMCRANLSRRTGCEHLHGEIGGEISISPILSRSKSTFIAEGMCHVHTELEPEQEDHRMLHGCETWQELFLDDDARSQSPSASLAHFLDTTRKSAEDSALVTLHSLEGLKALLSNIELASMV